MADPKKLTELLGVKISFDLKSRIRNTIPTGMNQPAYVRALLECGLKHYGWDGGNERTGTQAGVPSKS